MADVVLDSSALLARIWREPGSERVDEIIDGSRVSSVNIAEVVQKLVERGGDEVAIRQILDGLPCHIEPFDADCGFRTGLLRRVTKSKGASLGDRACLALGQRLGLPVYTADRVWAELDLGVEVVLIR